MNLKLSKYTADLEKLTTQGELLLVSMEKECDPDGFDKNISEAFKDGNKDQLLKSLPSFYQDYQSWYSETKVLIRQLLPDRLADLVRHYEKPKSRKEIDYENYRIEDYLQDLVVTSSNPFEGKKTIVGPSAALPHFRQQLAILKAVKARFESSLFDIAQLVQADVFDSELEAANELAKKGFARAAGALGGVVLERHLGHVSQRRAISISKRHPTIAVYNEALRDAGITDTPTWRFIQHLADIRNKCDHSGADPSGDQIIALLDGVAKIIKTVF